VSKALNIAGNVQNVFSLEAGRILAHGGKYSAALEYLGRAVREFPKSALAWYELGRCQSRLGFSEAEVSLQEAINLQPTWNAPIQELRNAQGNPLTRMFRRMFGR
jgi:tetratricopeptide (TPR) repeat protein